MADSRAKLISDAIVAALKTDAPNGVTVTKSRQIAIGEDQIPAGRARYSVYLGEQHPNPVGDPRRPTMRRPTLTINIRITAKGDDDTIDPHIVFIHSRMTADPTFGGVAMSVSEGPTTWFPDEATNGALILCIMQYTVEYTTNAKDLTQSH